MRSPGTNSFAALALLAVSCSSNGQSTGGGAGGSGTTGTSLVTTGVTGATTSGIGTTATNGTGTASVGGGSSTGIGTGTGTGTSGSTSATTTSSSTGGGPVIQTVFVIMMENHSWSDIKGNSSAPYINNTLLPMAAHAEAYKTPPGNHPSEPNYIWLEAGSNLGITTDDDPSSNHQSTTAHLVTQMDAAGVSWKAYAQGISGTDCPQADTGLFVVRHTPQLFFDDVTNGGDTSSANCIAHVRPYTELQTDLSANTVAQYNFITPDVCDDMHGQPFGVTCFALTANLVKEGDTFLSKAIPMITASQAYQNGGAIFVIWDEGTEPLGGTASDGPVPFFVVSNFAKPGYAGMLPYTHSSTVRTVQEIFGLSPFLGGAANATDLSDLFTTFP